MTPCASLPAERRFPLLPSGPLQQSNLPLTPSSYFCDLRSLYQAELDDLRTDSEGNDVLLRRLAEKRSELGFLLQMMMQNPEMLAVVLHQAFRFNSLATMNHLVTQEEGDLPAWSSLSDAVEIAPWADPVVQTILDEPMGDWFMTIAAALEYMHHHALAGAGSEWQSDSDDLPPEDQDAEETAARAAAEAGNDWMEAQGFDRKDTP